MLGYSNNMGFKVSTAVVMATVTENIVTFMQTN